MESTTLDKKEVKENYQYNGNNKSRIHTIRAMENNGSQFINYRCGRNSVNISKNICKEITETMNNLNWKQTNKKETSSNEETLLEHIKQLQKQINQIKKGK